MTKRYVLEATKTKAQVVAWLVEGRSTRDIAQELSTTRRKVTFQAVAAFAKRHADELAELRGKVAVAVANVTIAEKAERIRRASLVSDKTMEWIEAHGLITETETIGDKDERIVDRRFNHALVKAIVDLNRYVADELGQMPKPDVHINTGDTYNVALVNLADYSQEQQDAIMRLALKAGAA